MRLRVIAAAAGFLILFCLLQVRAQEEIDFGKDDSFQLLYNFGRVEEGEKINHTFEILNSSQFSWRVENILTSCGCVSAKLIEDEQTTDSTIAPGEVFKVEVEIDDTDHKGNLEQFVYVKIMQENETKILKLIMEGVVTK